jgi:dTDP-4-amino-4,6-dideoxygalactose transaminase
MNVIEYENLQKSNDIFFTKYLENFATFLKSGRYILGDNVTQFENDFANYCGVSNCIGVGSGLDALVLAIDAFNFPIDSEIIVPSNTYIATILAIVRNNLKPILVEPDIETYNIDAEKIEDKITRNTRAILIVHLYGKSCEMDKITTIAEKYKLNIIEDCAQAHGARFKKQKVGSFGVGCFSFYPTKNLGALGDAGMISSNNAEYANKIRSLRNYGSDKKYYNAEMGYNSRMDEVQAGFLSIKLRFLDDITKHKRRLAKIYLENLSNQFIKPSINANHYDVYHIFNIRHNNRDGLRRFLFENNIKTEIHYPVPPHRQKSMVSYIDGVYPISEEIHNTTLSLPISYFHTENDIERVCEVLNQWRD